MKLKYIEDYLSVEKFDVIELPQLTILTGLNGSGKTHLLLAIKMGKVSLDEIDADNIVGFNYHSFEAKDNTNMSHSRIERRRSEIYDVIVSIVEAIKVQNCQIENRIPKEIVQEICQIAETKRAIFFDLTLEDFQNKDIGEYYEQYNIYSDFIKKRIQRDRKKNDIYKVFERIIKPLEDIVFDDLRDLPHLDNSDFLMDQLGVIFMDYWTRLENNRYLTFRNKEYEEQNEVLKEGEFIIKYGGRPWNMINQILEGFGYLEYRVNIPEKIQAKDEFKVKLISTKDPNLQISLKDLSSGERTMMALVASIYKSKADRNFPQVLLLDEIDASLHPSMIKSMLDVFQNELINVNGIKIILATHSSSTVALAPEESIFVVNKIGPNRIEKTTKDKALKILNAGVPSFSVNYENRRQVFVESQNDVFFYERIYKKLFSQLEPEISLSFISSGESKTDKNGMPVSNCEQVKNIVDILRNSGNNFVWGIIDRDEKNTSKDYIRVLGNGTRYSIENYLLDSLLIGAFILREKIVSREEFNLTNNESFFDLRNFESLRLQLISNFVVEKVAKFVNPPDDSILKVKILNGLEIEIPKWYLDMQGHELEEKILKAFPKLNEIKRNNEVALKLAVIDKVVDDLPELVSIDLLEIFKEVQSVS